MFLVIYGRDWVIPRDYFSSIKYFTWSSQVPSRADRMPEPFHPWLVQSLVIDCLLWYVSMMVNVFVTVFFMYDHFSFFHWNWIEYHLNLSGCAAPPGWWTADWYNVAACWVLLNMEDGDSSFWIAVIKISESSTYRVAMILKVDKEIADNI